MISRMKCVADSLGTRTIFKGRANLRVMTTLVICDRQWEGVKKTNKKRECKVVRIMASILQVDPTSWIPSPAS